MKATGPAIVILLICMIASRMLAERAHRELSAEEKARMMDAFSGMRVWAFVPLVLIALAVVFGPMASWVWADLLPPAGIAAFAVYMGVLHVMVAQGLKRAGLPEGYRRRFLWSRHVSHAGLLLLLGAIIFDMMR
jgi:hypothetical protein